MKELTRKAMVEKISEVTDLAEEFLEEAGCPLKTRLQVDLAIDEVISNIANYAYKDAADSPEGQEGVSDDPDAEEDAAPGALRKGFFNVRMEIQEDPRGAVITFRDRGIPYDPLQKEDPDVTSSLQDRKIGGLGIFIVKKTMDEMTYERKDDTNILRIVKYF